MFELTNPAERHRSDRIGWLRAAVLGANDGILSTSSLIVGVASAHASHHNILITGVSGLVAGAMSMAAGEFVSVSSQSDTENADLKVELEELKSNPQGESAELAGIYVKRGLEPSLAKEVAKQLMVFDALDAHARDELGISSLTRARPLQAALASAGSFSFGAALPLLLTFIVVSAQFVPIIFGSSLLFLAALGALAARTGGANVLQGAARVTVWGALAMAFTAGMGLLSGAIL